MQFLPSYYQKQYEKTSEQAVRFGNQTLQAVDRYIQTHPVKEEVLNTAFVISQAVMLFFQLSNSLYAAVAGLATGTIMQQAVKRMDGMPRNLSSLAKTIENLWANKVVKLGTCICGILLLKFPEFAVTLITAVVTGAYFSNKFFNSMNISQ